MVLLYGDECVDDPDVRLILQEREEETRTSDCMLKWLGDYFLTNIQMIPPESPTFEWTDAMKQYPLTIGCFVPLTIMNTFSGDSRYGYGWQKFVPQILVPEHMRKWNHPHDPLPWIKCFC